MKTLLILLLLSGTAHATCYNTYSPQGWLVHSSGNTYGFYVYDQDYTTKRYWRLERLNGRFYGKWEYTQNKILTLGPGNWKASVYDVNSCGKRVGSPYYFGFVSIP